MPADPLTQALELAHARLEHDADAYADQDLLGMLVEAVEAERADAPTIGAMLLEGARTAALHAREAASLNHADGLAADSARKWADATRLMLESYRLAPLEGPVIGDDAERAEIASLITVYRDEIAAHRRELVELAQRFDSANTPTATRIAGAIERHLNAYGVSALTESTASND